MKTLADVLRPPFAVLAGAGISYAPPSSLPKAGDLMAAIVASLPIEAREKAELLAASSWAWDEGIGYYHILRFEQVMEALQLTMDPHLQTIRIALPEAEPNRYHYFLAGLIGQGFPVLTTNFDDLIEEACRNSRVDCRPVVTEKDYASYLSNPGKFKNPLFKLHGSLIRRRSTRELAATMTEVTHKMVSPSKWKAVQELLGKHDLLVIGYSGSDDFDIMPEINFAPNSRHLCWVYHNSTEPMTVFHGIKGKDSILCHQDQKLTWFFNRMFLSFDYQFGAISRKPEDTLLVDGDTAVIVDELAARLEVPMPPKATSIPQDRPNLANTPEQRLKRSGAKTLMLAGRLLQEIGRYEQASACLHEFLYGEASPLEQGRAHLWLAEMADERAHRASAVSHLKHAYRCLQNAAGALEWTDVVTLESLMRYAGHGRWLFDVLVAAGWPGGRDLSTLRGHLFAGWHLGRRHISGVIEALGREDMRGAEQSIGYLDEKHIPFDDELRADVAYWRGALHATLREQGKRSDEHVNRATEYAKEAEHIYERLQRRGKWIDSLIFIAEQDLPLWPDTAYRSAKFAAMIASFIGNDESVWHALERQADAAEIFRRRYGPEKTLEGEPLEDPDQLRRDAKAAQQRAVALNKKACCSANFSFDTQGEVVFEQDPPASF